MIILIADGAKAPTFRQSAEIILLQIIIASVFKVSVVSGIEHLDGAHVRIDERINSKVIEVSIAVVRRRMVELSGCALCYSEIVSREQIKALRIINRAATGKNRRLEDIDMAVSGATQTAQLLAANGHKLAVGIVIRRRRGENLIVSPAQAIGMIADGKKVKFRHIFGLSKSARRRLAARPGVFG